MSDALDLELRRFFRLAIRLWQIIALLGLVTSLLVAATVSAGVGLTMAAIAAIYLAIMSPFVRRVEDDKPLARGVEELGAVIEASVPWTCLIVLGFVEGGDYALASWVPPILFGIVLLLNVIRLRVLAPLIIGIAGGLTFPLCYFLLLRDRVPAELATHMLFEAPMQVTRGISLVAFGIVAALGTRYLREAIVRAEGTFRQRDLFGKYRLLRPIASGGMGEVIEALYCPEGGFERRVAIKRIHEHLAGQPRFVDQFRTEAELCSRLAHPNVVQVMDFGRVETTYFLAMEYVDGMTLGEFMARSSQREMPMPEHVAGAIARHILEGLDHAHRVARGADGRPLRVIHRDLCPHNVLIGANGEVKITDFGVARALKDTSASLTKTVVGHTAYLAPEQALAGPLDERVDLFAVGVIVWEMLTARRLFHRATDAATVQAILGDSVPSVRSYRPELSPGWDAFLAQALARDARRRFVSAGAMLARLDDIPTSRGDGSIQQLAGLMELLGDDTAGDDPTWGETQSLRAA